MESCRRRWSVFLSATVLLVRLASAAPAWCDPQPSDLVVTDLTGRRVQPLAASEVRTSVFVFTRTDCPIAARYLPELERLQQRASAGAVFWLVFVDRDEPAEAITAYLKSYGFHGRVVRDRAHALVRLAGVSITPEAAVFVHGASGPTLVYRGRIDDRYVDLGRVRPAPTVRDLAEVLDALRSGASLRFRSTEAVGCVIADLR